MQGCILSPCLFNFYAEYIMRNTGLQEAQAGLKIAGRKINNLRYADFSNAKFEVKKDGISGAILKVTGIKGVSDLDEFRSLSRLFITETNAKPVIDGYYVNGKNWTEGKSFLRNEDDAGTLMVYGLEKYVELKKDYYFSVVQSCEELTHWKRL